MLAGVQRGIRREVSGRAWGVACRCMSHHSTPCRSFCLVYICFRQLRRIRNVQMGALSAMQVQTQCMVAMRWCHAVCVLEGRKRKRRNKVAKRGKKHVGMHAVCGTTGGKMLANGRHGLPAGTSSFLACLTSMPATACRPSPAQGSCPSFFPLTQGCVCGVGNGKACVVGVCAVVCVWKPGAASHPLSRPTQREVLGEGRREREREVGEGRRSRA